MARMTRRGILGGGAAAAAAGLAGAASAQPPAHAGDDAELVTLCGQFMVLQTKLDAMGATTVPVRTEGPEYGPHRDAAIDDIVDRQGDILDKMHDLTATTLAGHQARAMTFDKWCSRDGDGDFDLVVSWGDIRPLIQDLVRGTV